MKYNIYLARQTLTPLTSQREGKLNKLDFFFKRKKIILLLRWKFLQHKRSQVRGVLSDLVNKNVQYCQYNFLHSIEKPNITSQMSKC